MKLSTVILAGILGTAPLGAAFAQGVRGGGEVVDVNGKYVMRGSSKNPSLIATPALR